MKKNNENFDDCKKNSLHDVVPLVSNLIAESGKKYGMNKFEPNSFQYMDRDYKFEYIPTELLGAVHIRTCGNDKLISENKKCISFDVDRDVDVFVGCNVPANTRC